MDERSRGRLCSDVVANANQRWFREAWELAHAGEYRQMVRPPRCPTRVKETNGQRLSPPAYASLTPSVRADSGALTLAQALLSEMLASGYGCTKDEEAAANVGPAPPRPSLVFCRLLARSMSLSRRPAWHNSLMTMNPGGAFGSPQWAERAKKGRAYREGVYCTI